MKNHGQPYNFLRKLIFYFFLILDKKGKRKKIQGGYFPLLMRTELKKAKEL
jgi:hypothetical protein